MMPWWLIALLTLVFAASGVAAIRMPYAPPRTPATSIEAPQDEYLWEATTLKGVGTELGPYEVYLSEPEFEDPTSYVVFLPGNPGMAGFYCEYADSLCERTGASVLVMGLVGHIGRSASSSLPAAERRRVYSLEDQLKHVVARAAPVQAQAGDRGVPFTIVGHSIGGWIALRAAQQLQRQPTSPAKPRLSKSPSRRGSSGTSRPSPGPSAIASDASLPEPHVLLLTPFLDVPSSMPTLAAKRRLLHSPLLGESGGGGGGGGGDDGGGTSNSAAYFAQTGGTPPEQPLSFATLTTPLVGYFASFLCTLPAPLRRAVLSRQTAELDADHREYVVRELAYRHNLRNILYLARTEFAVLEQPLDWAELAPLIAADRVRALYVPEDEWAPVAMLERAQELGMVAELLESDEEVEMKHAFSVREESCERVAEWTAKAMGQMTMGLRG